MTNKITEKRGRGRPATFPGQECKALAVNLPLSTIEILQKDSERRDRTLNANVDAAIRAYCRTRSKRPATA